MINKRENKYCFNLHQTVNWKTDTRKKKHFKNNFLKNKINKYTLMSNLLFSDFVFENI